MFAKAMCPDSLPKHTAYIVCLFSLSCLMNWTNSYYMIFLVISVLMLLVWVLLLSMRCNTSNAKVVCAVGVLLVTIWCIYTMTLYTAAPTRTPHYPPSYLFNYNHPCGAWVQVFPVGMSSWSILWGDSHHSRGSHVRQQIMPLSILMKYQPQWNNSSLPVVC